MRIPLSKTNTVLGCLIAAALFFFIASIAVGTARGDSGIDYRITQDRDNIREAQANASSAHVSLQKAREAVKAAVASEKQAQDVVDAYSNTANSARENICKLSKLHCTREFLDPMNTGINLDEFFISPRQ